MPVEVHHSPPPLHHPGEVTKRPRGILKNPSFSGPSGADARQPSPTKIASVELPPTPSSIPLDPEQAKEQTLKNTLQNAGHRRSSSAARRASASRRQSAAALGQDDDPDKMRLKWDEANLYLAEQESGGRMKITEPKTPYQYGDAGAMEEEDEEDVAIDPRYVNVDEVDMAKKGLRKHRESEIPGLELGEPEEELTSTGIENERITRGGSLSRENSKEKHVSVSSGSGEGLERQVGMPTPEDQEKHKMFEERRKRHYEMRNMKGLLGHPEDIDEMDEGDGSNFGFTALPDRGVNGTAR